MVQKVKVIAHNADGTAQVMHVRQSACSGDCHQCSGCGAAKETMMLTAENPIGAQVGDTVLLRSSSGPVLKAAALLYLLPLLLFFAGYAAGMLLWERGGAVGCAAFCVGIGVSILYDRFVLKKQKTVYVITEYARTDTMDF